MPALVCPDPYGELAKLSGTRKTIDLPALEPLGLLPSVLLRETAYGRPCRAFHRAGVEVELAVGQPVWSFQGAVRVETVRANLDALLHTGVAGPVMVTDRPGAEHGLWLLDGHHALLAARLAGVAVTADLWR